MDCSGRQFELGTRGGGFTPVGPRILQDIAEQESLRWLGGKSNFGGIDHHAISEAKRGIYCLLSKVHGGRRYGTHRT